MKLGDHGAEVGVVAGAHVVGARDLDPPKADLSFHGQTHLKNDDKKFLLITVQLSASMVLNVLIVII